MRRKVLILLVVVFCASLLLAQRYRYRGGEGMPEDSPFRTAREVPTHSTEFPRWTNAPGFGRDVFTFVRIRYKSHPQFRLRGFCFVDFPDSDLNLSYRLQQMTSLKVDPDGRVLSLTDPELFNYPWSYMVEPGFLRLDEDEALALRRYLLNGGFLMVDDFWGTRQWDSFARQMKIVFPEREFVELGMDHPIFRCVFDLSGKQKSELQVPNVEVGEISEETGVTWEYHNGEECRELHLRALLDDKGRIMVMACHNTDYGDGWEREQEDRYFFREFSEKRAYPLAINIIFYAMTH